nr:hypothetical protein [Anaerolineae bacterium]
MKWQRVAALAAFLWFGVLAVGYMVVHAPVAAASLAGLGRTLLCILAVLLLVALAGALGTLVTGRLAGLYDLERVAVSLLFGLALISLVILLLSLLHLYPPAWLGWLLTAGLTSVLFRPLAGWWRKLTNGMRSCITREDGWYLRFVQLSILVMLVLALILALAPPTKWDSLTYHLVGPETYLENGGTVSIPENHFLGFPMLAHMLYLWVMLLSGPNAVALLHAVFGLAALLLVLGFSQRIGYRSAGWLAVAVLLISDTIRGEFSWPYIDLALMAYTFAAVALVIADGENGAGYRYTILSGIFVGCMLGVKYTAATYTIGLGLLSLWAHRKPSWWRSVKITALLTFVALLSFSPWLVKNRIVDGNPIAPFVWGTAGFDELDQWYYLLPGTGLSLLEILVLPVQVPVFGAEMGTFQGATGPLLFALIPFAFLGWKKRLLGYRRAVVSLSVVAGCGYAAWLAGAASSWLLL